MGRRGEAGMKGLGLTLAAAGALLLVAGCLLLLGARFPWLGHLPGDIHVQGRRWSFSFPLATCILISIVLTIVLALISRFTRR
jgi:hypothetical protein